MYTYYVRQKALEWCKVEYIKKTDDIGFRRKWKNSCIKKNWGLPHGFQFGAIRQLVIFSTVVCEDSLLLDRKITNNILFHEGSKTRSLNRNKGLSYVYFLEF